MSRPAPAPLGILVAKPPESPQKDEELGPLWPSQSAYLAELTTAGTAYGFLVYVFTPAGVNWQNRRVRGYRFHSGRWQQGWFPLPQVVYNRILDRRVEKNEPVAALRERLGVPWFNTAYLDKWQVHQVLTGRALPLALPHTELYQQPSQAARLLGRYRTLFLKPTRGSLGRGILRLSRASALAGHLLRRGRMGKNPWPQPWKRRLSSRPYIVQQGIDLARVGASHFDLRLLVSKDGSGRWRLTSAAARVAVPGAAVSNQAAGATLVKPGAALAQAGLPHPKGKRLLPWLAGLAVPVAEAVEAGTGYCLGELGIDVGVDRAGRPWLIEVNSRPSKNELGPPEPRRLRLSSRRVLQFAGYLLRQGERP